MASTIPAIRPAFGPGGGEGVVGTKRTRGDGVYPLLGDDVPTGLCVGNGVGELVKVLVIDGALVRVAVSVLDDVPVEVGDAECVAVEVADRDAVTVELGDADCVAVVESVAVLDADARRERLAVGVDVAVGV